MKFLVTGGLGFIGRALTLRLLAAGHAVRIVDSLTRQVHGDAPLVDAPDGAELFRIDVRELSEHHNLLDGIDAVYHLAAETGTAQSMYQMRHYVEVNEGGTASLLEAVGKSRDRPPKLILASSRSVYGEGAFLDSSCRLVQPVPRSKQQLDAGQWELVGDDGHELRPAATPETLGFAPGSVYAATKAAQELLINSTARALGFTTVILRLQNVYGEGQSLQNPYTGIISIFFNRARQGLALPIYEDGLETRDFVHVDDVVTAMAAAAERNVPNGTVCNVGSGVATTVKSLAEQLIAAAGARTETRVTGQFRLGDIRHNFADISQARALLGYEPEVSLGDGLSRFCTWASSQPVYADQLDRAAAELRSRGLAK